MGGQLCEATGRQLAQVTGADHPLHGSSLQRLMVTDPTMITPQAQAQGLRAHEVIATTRAAREAIRTASRVIAKPSPWSTIKQSESESFTKFVDCLQAAVDSSALPAEAKGPVIAECLRQQCNSTTKEILRSLPAGSSIADMIKHVAKEKHLTSIQVAVCTIIARIKLMKTVSFCSQDWIIGHPRNQYTPVTREDDKLANVLSKPGSSSLAEPRQRQNSLRKEGLRCLCVILILELVTIGQAELDYHHHQPYRRILRDLASDRVIRENITVGPIAMIVMTLIFGPCILNRIVSFVKSQLEKVNIMFVEHRQLF